MNALWFWDDPILAGPWKTPPSWAIFMALADPKSRYEFLVKHNVYHWAASYLRH